MKLYMHPVSTVCRPVRLLVAEYDIPMEEEVVDLMTGAHHGEKYVALNPNRQVPTLVDGDLTLTEGSAILKYLGEKFDLAVYPKADIKTRAKINEAMDWLNTGFYRDFGYNLVYPQLFPHHKRRSDEAHAATLEWGREQSKKWLGLLNDHWIGDRPYLVGNAITIADYFGSGLATIGDLIGCQLGTYPNICRWLGNMKKLKHWDEVNQVFTGFAAGNKGKQFAVV
jgi:glutathione S-transferase